MAVTVSNPVKLVMDYLSLPLSKRRSIAERYGAFTPGEDEMKRSQRTIDAVIEQGKIVEFALLVNEAKSKGANRGRHRR